MPRRVVSDGDDDVRERGHAQRREDVKALLRYAYEVDPDSAEGTTALETAKAASLRLAREMRQQAIRSGDLGPAEADRLAQEDYFRAVLAQELPKLARLLRQRATIEPDQAPTGPVALLLQPPPAPTDVEATPLVHGARVSWQTAGGPLETATSFTVHTLIDQQPVGAPLHALASPAVVSGLQPGTAYQFAVTATNSAGTSPQSALSNTITPDALPTPQLGQPLAVQLPVFSSDPLLLLDDDVQAARNDVAAPVAMANKWRYEHLKAVAVAAAKDSLALEQQIAGVMALAMDKVGLAEEITNNSLTEAVKNVQSIATDLAETVAAPEVTDLLQPLADAAADSLLLPRFLAFLARTSPLDFWTGLFGALISDLASVVPLFGDDTDFNRTKRHLRATFNDDVDGIRAAIRAETQAVIAGLDTEVEAMVAPLRAAVAEVVAGTRQAMAEVFEASDITLLMTPAKDGVGANVPDVDPFRDLADRLNAEVDRLAADISDRIRAALQPLASGNPDLFVKLCVTYLAIPLLAFLVISLAGGPFSAALLAAIVLVAAQELVRLLVRWLTGPLLRKVDELKQRTTEVMADLQRFFGQQAAVVRNQSPEGLLKILAAQLRQLTDFLPQTFMEETAAVLEEARNVILRTGTQLALAAEQAVGQENATAFDTIAYDYTTGLSQAPQMPGGRDPRRLGGAALLRDLGRLEENRLSLRDPKDMVFTHRLSIADILGGATPFQDFLSRGALRLDLDEGALLDRQMPGIYRAQIIGLDAYGVVGSALQNAAPAIPLAVTHLGASSTRIKHDANPAAPPLHPPDCLPRDPDAFAEAVVGVELLTADIMAALAEREEVTRGYWVLALILTAILNPGEDAMELVMNGLRADLLAHLPNVLTQRAAAASCGLIDREALQQAIEQTVRYTPFADVLDDYIFDPGGGDDLILHREIAPRLAPRLRAGAPFTLQDLLGNLGATEVLDPTRPPGPSRPPPRPRPRRVPGLVAVLKRAHADALRRFLPRMAKWGDATLVQDPDPQVRSLGFSRLTRQGAPETTVFNLMSAPPPTPTAGAHVLGAPPPSVPAGGAGQQYTTFENRGLGGSLLLQLHAPASSVTSLLTDIVLDVTVRGCYDADLAQTLRASTQQAAAGFGLVGGLVGGAGIQVPGASPNVTAGVTDLRTLHVNLRGHRDRTLAVWQSAAQALPGVPPVIQQQIVGGSLGRDAGFRPLDAVTQFQLRFSSSNPPTTTQSLLDLASTILMGPGDLGLDPSVVTGRPVAEQARVAGIGIAVIPMPGGVHPDDVDPTALTDPLGVQVAGSGALAGLVPVTGAMPQRLAISSIAPADQPLVSDLFDVAGTSLDLMFTGQDVFGDTSKLYDVIVSLSLRLPVLSAAPSDAVFA